MIAKLLNLALYQAGWFACVLGAASGRPGWGAAAALTLIAAHLLLVRDRGEELRLILFAGALGAAVDTLQLRLGVFSFPSGQLAFGPAGLAPPWIVVMWMQFATLFRFCLRWLGGRYLLSGLLGLVGGPLSFLAGERLGAVVFLAPRGRGLAILAAVWALAMPALVWAADRRRDASYRLG